MVASMRIEGRQICLRDWEMTDLASYQHWMTPGQRWKELDSPYYPLPSALSVGLMLVQLQTQIEQNDFPTVRNRLIINDRTSNAFIGMVTWNWESEETYWPTLGIVLFDPNSWRQGRGFEALGLWSDYLFQALPAIVRLDLRTWSGNTGMMRLATKIGYKQEACFRKARIVDGKYYDGLGYGILREEWHARYPEGFYRHLQAMP